MQIPNTPDATAAALAQRFGGDYAHLLPREEEIPAIPRQVIEGRRVLVTGAEGFLGRRVGQKLDDLGADTYLTDLDDLDITDADLVDRTIRQLQPDMIVHLAAMKHAPLGELHPLETAEINVNGTANVVEAAKVAGVAPGRMVFVSTCKAAAPETVYGATKLLGERIALGAGYAVVRLGNVLGSSGSVLEIWQSQSARGDALAVTPCRRFWLTPSEAVGLILSPFVLGPGLYHFDAGEAEDVENLARRFDPTREIEHVPPRRGDRLVERFLADGERAETTALRPVRRILEAWEQTPE
jgi:FlaA1/EpsC-like NDP-sugar epimerase